MTRCSLVNAEVLEECDVTRFQPAIFSEQRGGSRSVVSRMTGRATRERRTEGRNGSVAGGTTPDQEDHVAWTIEQETASPVETVIGLLFVETARTHLRVLR